MFTGQIAVISKNATWLSQVYEPLDETDNTQIDLSAGGLTVAIEVTIKDFENCTLATATLVNGKVALSAPAPAGFFWQFEVGDLSRLCAGTYRLIALVTINGFVSEEINGEVGVTD